MGFFRSLFLGSSSSNNNNNKNSLKKGSGAYESTVALEPPVKGSYPVAGNGNVEETLKRAKVRRDSQYQNSLRTSSFVGSLKPPPNLPQAQSQRPRTAPHNGEPGGGQRTGLGDERTQSGFSMKAPPSIFNNRRNSLRSTRSPPPVEPQYTPSQVSEPRQVQTYQPRTATSTPLPTSTPVYADREPLFTPPYVENHHQRNLSHASQSSHVDILDAYSSIRGKEVSKNRVKAAGVRNYGEDVADRNIVDFGEKDLQNLDMNSQEFGYMKTVYAGKKRQGGDGVAQRDAPNRSNIDGDDTTHTTHAPTSRFSTASRPGVISPPRHNHSDQIGSSHAHRSGVPSTLNQEYRSVKGSRQINNDISSSQPSQYYTTSSHHPPVDPPARVTSLNQSRATSAQETPRTFQNPPRITSPAHSRKSSSTRPSSQHGRTTSRNSASYSAFPQVSPREQSNQGHPSPNTSRPMTSPGKRSYLVEGAREAPSLEGVVDLKNSVDTEVTTKTLPGTYNSLALQPPPARSTLSRPQSSTSIRSNYSASRYANYWDPPLAQLPSTKTNSSTTSLNTFKPGIWPPPKLHAVTHEFVQPTVHEHRQEKITREIHTHDVFHRIQPIIQTEILPAKHYIHAPDGKSLIEIPESQIPGRTHAGAASKNWKIVETPLGHGDYNYQSQQSRSNLSYVPPQTIANDAGIDEAAEPPTIPLVRADGQSGTQSRGTSITTRTKSILEPILASKRESKTAEGFPRTEYLWRHPPTFENCSRPGSDRGGNNPVYVGAGIGDISDIGAAAVNKRNTRSSDSSNDSERGYVLDDGMRQRAKEGEEVLFRDSGYGSGGGLPGISISGRQPPHGLVKGFEKMQIGGGHHPRQSSARTLRDDVLAENDCEDQPSNARNRQSSREVRTKKSRVDLRRVADEQARVRY